MSHYLNHEYIFLKLDDDREIVLKKNNGRGDHPYNYIGEMEDCGESHQLHTHEDDIIVVGRWWSSKRIGCINGEIGWVCRDIDFITHNIGKQLFFLLDLAIDTAFTAIGDPFIDEKIKGLTNEELTAFITGPPYPSVSKKMQRIFFGEIVDQSAPEENGGDDGVCDSSSTSYNNDDDNYNTSDANSSDDNDDDDYYYTPVQATALAPTPKPEPQLSEFEEYRQWNQNLFKRDLDNDALVELIKEVIFSSEFKKEALSKITDQKILVDLYWDNRQSRKEGLVPYNGLYSNQILKYITDPILRAEIDYAEEKNLSSMNPSEIEFIGRNNSNPNVCLKAVDVLVSLNRFELVDCIANQAMHDSVRIYAKQCCDQHRRELFWKNFAELLVFLFGALSVAVVKISQGIYCTATLTYRGLSSLFKQR
jgi:hypothetical protein